jgi:hypothetical protein
MGYLLWKRGKRPLWWEDFTSIFGEQPIRRHVYKDEAEKQIANFTEQLSEQLSLVFKQWNYILK